MSQEHIGGPHIVDLSDELLYLNRTHREPETGEGLDDMKAVFASVREKLRAALQILGATLGPEFDEDTVSANISYGISQGIGFPRQRALRFATLMLDNFCTSHYGEQEIDQLFVAAALFRAACKEQSVHDCMGLATLDMDIDALEGAPVDVHMHRRYALQLGLVILHTVLPDELESAERGIITSDEAPATDWLQQEQATIMVQTAFERIEQEISTLLRAIRFADLPVDRQTLRILGEVHQEVHDSCLLAMVLQKIAEGSLELTDVPIDENEHSTVMHERFRKHARDFAGLQAWMASVSELQEQVARAYEGEPRRPRRSAKKEL